MLLCALRLHGRWPINSSCNELRFTGLTLTCVLQQGETAPAPQAASSHAPTVEAPRSFEGRGGRGGRGSYGRGGREGGFEGSGRRGGGRGYGRGGREGGFEGSGRRGGGSRTSGDLGPRSASTTPHLSMCAQLDVYYCHSPCLCWQGYGW